MNLQERVAEDIKNAMKAKDAATLEPLRMLKAQFIHNNTAVKPLDDLSVAAAYVKKIQDSLELYQAGTPAYEKIMQELSVLKRYLPQAMSEAELRDLISELKKAGATDMGKMMKELQPKMKGRFDGKRASEIVKEMLA
jgi:uncharacterized protein YqeY